MPEESMHRNALARILAETDHCNKCGFCLPACPTYRVTGQELHSPRGRIAMVEAAARDELPDWKGLEESLSYCVGCRACEPACPSGVHYERILEAGREALIRRGSVAFRGSLASRGARYLSKHRTAFGQLVRLGRRLGKWMPDVGLGGDIVAMLPKRIDGPLGVSTRQSRPPSEGPRVGYFTGCVMDSIFAEANRAALDLLTAAGYQVDIVSEQTCCGALHLHSGEPAAAKEMAQANLRAFESQNWDFIANAAGGCGAMLHEYDVLLADDREWHERAVRFVSRVRDFSTLLGPAAPYELPFEGSGIRVALQNSCHLANVQHAGGDAMALLLRVRGDMLIHFPDEAMCCGSGGLYNMNHRDWASAILDEKMAKLTSVRPNLLLVNNPGCQLQMQAGVIRRSEPGLTVEHLASYLWRAYRATEPSAASVQEAWPQ